MRLSGVAPVALRRRSASGSRRGSVYVSSVVSSSSSSSGSEDEALEMQRRQRRRQRSQWSRRSSSESSESSSFSMGEKNDGNEGLQGQEGDLADVYEDFVTRRQSLHSRKAPPHGQPSVAKLDRLRRIFLNMPSATMEKKTKESKQRSQHVQSKRKSGTNHTNGSNNSSLDGTNSNSSGDDVDGIAPTKSHGIRKPTPVAALTLPIDHHVKTLSEQVARLTRQHDAHAQQWQTMLTQAVAELQFVKQQEERALQSHVRLLQESYALRLEVFEQQYRAKVAEIRDQLQAEIAQHRLQSDNVIVTTAKRLQQQAQQVLLETDNGHTAVSESNGVSVTLAKTNQFLERQQAREDARRSRLEPHTNTKTDSKPRDAGSMALLSPVARQRAKLKMLEQKLASFPRDTVERVTRSVENQERERRSRGAVTATAGVKCSTAQDTLPSTVHAHAHAYAHGQDDLPPTPLSPLRKRSSYWHNGISREQPANGDGRLEPIEAPSSSAGLSRRFLRPEEERELLALRNSIGLAKDWMEIHH